MSKALLLKDLKMASYSRLTGGIVLRNGEPLTKPELIEEIKTVEKGEGFDEYKIVDEDTLLAVVYTKNPKQEYSRRTGVKITLKTNKRFQKELDFKLFGNKPLPKSIHFGDGVPIGYSY